MALCLGLRFYQIGAQSYWLDEMVSLHFAGNQFLKAVLWDNHPPLYFLILKAWLHFFGYSEIATRGLSAIISTGTLTVLLYQLTKRWGGMWAFLAGCLFILSPAQILMSQETRMYTLFELGLAIQYFCFLDWFSNRDRRNLKWLIGSTVFFLCTHYLAVVVLVAETLFAWKGHLIRRKWWILGTLIAWSCLVVFVLVDWKYLRWQKQSWLEVSALQEFLHLVSDLFWGRAAFGLVALVLSVYSVRKNKDNLELCILLLPWFSISILLSIGLVMGRNIFFVRYFEFLIVPFIVSIVLALRSLSKWLVGVGIAIVVICCAIYLPEVYAIKKAPWKDVAAYIGENPGPVYTTRTLALETPYFSSRKIPVLRYVNVASLPLKKEPVYIVETYFQGITSFPVIQEQLHQSGVQSEMLQFERNGSDIVLVLRILPH